MKDVNPAPLDKGPQFSFLRSIAMLSDSVLLFVLMGSVTALFLGHAKI